MSLENKPKWLKFLNLEKTSKINPKRSTKIHHSQTCECDGKRKIMKTAKANDTIPTGKKKCIKQWICH